MKIHSQLFAAAFVLACLGNQAQAAAVNLTASPVTYVNGSWTLGFEFTVSQNVAITSLGIFDDYQGGLPTTGRVGLWDTSGNLLTSTTVAPGTAGTLDGFFRYNSITPYGLTAGVHYVVAAQLDNSDYSLLTVRYDSGAFDPLVSVVRDRWSSTKGYAFANTSTFEGAAWLGANFRFAGASAVPTPSTLGLVGLSLAGLGLVTRRKA